MYLLSHLHSKTPYETRERERGTKSQGGEPTYNVAVGRAGRGKQDTLLVKTCMPEYNLLRNFFSVLNKSVSP